ncbi:hypothetical protein ACQJBY_066666 [Aegilops geniculata]
MNKCKDQKLELLLTGSSTSRVAPGSSTSRPAWEEQQLAGEQQVEERSGGDDRGLEVEDELQFQARRELQVQALETQACAGPGGGAGPGWREGIAVQPWATEGVMAGEDGGGAALFSRGAAARRGGRRGGAGGRRNSPRAAQVGAGGVGSQRWCSSPRAAMVHSGGAGRGHRHALGPTTGADGGLGGGRRKEEEATGG